MREVPVSCRTLTAYSQLLRLTQENYIKDLKDYQLVSLLSVVYNCAALGLNQMKQQVGFHSCYSTTDYIHVPYQVVQIHAEYTKLLCMAFID